MDQEALVMRALYLHGLPPPETDDALETFLADVKEATDEVLAFNADWEKQRWTRIHVALVRSGIWAQLKPCSRSVYMVLAALADRRKRVTIAGVEKVAKLSGLSVPRTMFAYRELRDFGLIWRRRIRLGDRQPYMTGLTNPRRWGATVEQRPRRG